MFIFNKLNCALCKIIKDFFKKISYSKPWAGWFSRDFFQVMRVSLLVWRQRLSLSPTGM